MDVDNSEVEELKQNRFKSSWQYFSSLNKFKKISIAATFFILVAALISIPFIINNRQTIEQHAQSPDQVPVSRIDTTGKFVDGEALIKFKQGVSQTTQNSLLKENQASIVREIPQIGVKQIKVPTQALDNVIAAFSHNPAVQFIEKNSLAAVQDTIPNDPWWPSEWGEVKTQSNKAWDTSKGIPNVVIAILDTGVDFTQPDLQGKFVQGYDIVNNDNDPTDDHGHGTYVAGVASAVTNNATGVASYCWNCSIQPVKVLDSSGSGAYSNVASGIIWATDHGAKIINMSLGGTSTSSTLQSAVQYAHNKGVILVAAAGNYGTTTPIYPAAYPEVLGVAGTDGNDALYSWSSYGSWVKISAPGCNLATGRNAWYGTFCGTSSAAPAAAGIAGLVFSYLPNATNTQVETAIENSAVRIGNAVQYGRVDAYAALLSLGGTPLSTPTPTPTVTSDSTPPLVSIANPVNGSVLTRNSNITISSNASDNIAVAKVETYVNGALICTTITSLNGQYNCVWKVPGKRNASYVITSKAYDTSGNISVSPVISVTSK